jgi:signal transduction histidine kinase
MAVDGRSRWSIWIAWSICCLAVAQVGAYWLVPSADDTAARSAIVFHLIGLTSALAVLLASGWQRQAGGTGWGWLLLAPALGIQLWATLLDIIPSALLPAKSSLLSVVVICLAGLASVFGPARLWAEQSITAGSTLQRLVESGIIALTAFALLGSLARVTIPAWPIDPRLVVTLIVDYLLLCGLGTLLVAGRKLTGFIVGAVLCRLATIGFGAFAEPGQDALALPIETAQWALLALAAAYRGRPLSSQADSATALERDDSWRGSSLARSVMVLGLLIAATWPPAPTVLVVGFLVLSVGYEGCLRVRHQTAQRRRREELQRERTAFQHARNHDHQLIQSLARLIHDLGPPVQGVSSIADQLLRIAAREERESPRTISERLGRHADYLEHLIRQLNARLRRQNPPTLRRCRVDVMLIATTVVESLRPLARRRSIDLSVSLGTEATEVLGDENAIRRILDNLVSNALAVTPAAGVIVVELWIDRAYTDALTISVRDSGPGLSTAEQQRVFLPREQPSVGPGMGLGLSIVAELTEYLGGAYGVQSETGGGSTFWVRLPREEEAIR